MDSALLKSLLSRGESEALDFKSDQYTLAGDEAKGEFLKDVLAFVNTPRGADAYIILGVKKRPGQPDVVCGITSDRDDNDFQTLARGKITSPIQFTYESFDYDGKKFGVIRIPVQKRPAYVMNDFGKLREKAVYIRRGSSTGIATPEEIVQMVVPELKQPDFALLARAGLKTEGAGHTLWLYTWLRNTSEVTADDVTVDVTSHKQPSINPSDWKNERIGNPRRYVSEHPIHPLDDVLLVSWMIVFIAGASVPVAPVAYKGGPLSAKIVIRTKDRKPLTFDLQYTQEEICLLKLKQLEPT